MVLSAHMSALPAMRQDRPRPLGRATVELTGLVVASALQLVGMINVQIARIIITDLLAQTNVCAL